MKLTYQQAYDLIIQAYFKNEIEPFRAKYCFCGTLSPDSHWNLQSSANEYPYTWREYNRMEEALFTGMRKFGLLEVFEQHRSGCLYEDAIFKGMCMALDVLKQIHIERGDFVETPVFTKRVKAVAV